MIPLRVYSYKNNGNYLKKSAPYYILCVMLASLFTCLYGYVLFYLLTTAMHLTVNDSASGTTTTEKAIGGGHLACIVVFNRIGYSAPARVLTPRHTESCCLQTFLSLPHHP